LERPLKEAVLKKAFQMTSLRLDKALDSVQSLSKLDDSSPHKRGFSTGVHPIQAIRLGTIINERRSSERPSLQ